MQQCSRSSKSVRCLRNLNQQIWVHTSRPSVCKTVCSDQKRDVSVRSQKLDIVALVTGCSDGGIGSELCKTMISRGCTVVATSRNLKSMEHLRGSSASCLAMDVTDEASIQEALDKAISLHGRVDLLVNNAGCAAFGPVMEMELKVFKDVFEINLMGVVAVSKAVTPHMLKQGGGRIVNIGSIAAWHCVPFTAPYSASKAALESLSQAMRLELKPFGIHVLHVAPGFIRSSLGNKIRGGTVYEGSMFKDVPAAVEKMDFLGNGTLSPSAMPTEKFASQLCDMMLGNPSAWPPVWYVGPNSSMLAFARRFAPTWVIDAVLSRMCGLS